MLHSSTDKIHSFLAKRQGKNNYTTCKNKLTLFLTCIIQRVLCDQVHEKYLMPGRIQPLRGLLEPLSI